jgi:hypothetical protein
MREGHRDGSKALEKTPRKVVHPQRISMAQKAATITALGYLVMVGYCGREDDDAGDRSKESASLGGVCKGVRVRGIKEIREIHVLQ